MGLRPSGMPDAIPLGVLGCTPEVLLDAFEDRWGPIIGSERRAGLEQYFAGAAALDQNDIRAANIVIEENMGRRNGMSGPVTLGQLGCTPEVLLDAFEDRWGPIIGPEIAILMPPPPDIPSKPESVANENEPLPPDEGTGRFAARKSE